MEHHMEILAPAGDVQGVIAAINGGADAVYFGGKHFNGQIILMNRKWWRWLIYAIAMD